MFVGRAEHCRPTGGTEERLAAGQPKATGALEEG
jgi:hypothetical protein